MNTGFADAEFLAALLDARLTSPHAPLMKTWNRLYTQLRRQAAKTAATRAELAMAAGTVRGPVAAVRNLALLFVLRVLNAVLPPFYTMQTIPFRNLAEARKKYPQSLAALLDCP